MNMNEFYLPSLSRWHKARLMPYVFQLLEAQKKMLTQDGKNILHYTLEKKRRHQHMNHYPKGDRIDKSTGAQYFYHCHRENLESTEHGHFHCFMRYKNIPKHIKPERLSDWDRYIDNPMAQIAAISMNRYGHPIRLFTINRWMSAEIWYNAKQVSSFIKRFEMTLKEDLYWQILDKWVEAMLQIFAPQISWLHYKREEQIKFWQQEHPEDNAYEVRELEELSTINIDLHQQINWIAQS